MIRVLLLTPQGETSHDIEPPMTLGEAVERLTDAPHRFVALGIWGQVKPASTLLKDGDRVECYEALRADPKTARRKKVVRPKGARMGKM
jgi:putative ubiquitin-RnfH superfamily antitoxin RatB of RatAB toxin-antitoxin module